MAQNQPEKLSIEGAGEMTITRPGPLRTLGKAAFLMGLWLLLSGHYDFFHISMGVASVAFVIAMNQRLVSIHFFPGKKAEWSAVRPLNAVLYLPWLVWEIFKASIQVAKVVINPRRFPVNSSIVRFRSNLPTIGEHVMLGHAITIMPGTVTIAIDGDDFLVHSLIDDSHASLVDGSMSAKIRGLFEGSAEGPLVEHVQIIRRLKDL
jgi:multicomponent Na+:H+ antiporter subunit E